MITKACLQELYKNYRVLAKADDFTYLLPHYALQGLISNYSITFPNKTMFTNNYTVIPHGSATLVFSFDGKNLYGDLFGPATKPCSVGRRANQFNMLFIVEFQPAGLYTFTGINQRELTDYTVNFELVNVMLFRLISKALENAKSINELIACIDQIMLVSLNRCYPAELDSTKQLIINSMGNISIKKLSDSAFYSERHLNRIFDRYLGMSVKTFSRLVRINKAIRLLRNPCNSIIKTCILTGFYDLPHFIHDFKSVCGFTPQEYRCNMSDFYNEIAKF